MTDSADQPIRVLICDDHAVVCQGLRAFLASQAGIEVVAEANTGNDAVRLAEELSPDVVVVDLLMPAGDGFDATIKIRGARPQTQIVILTSYTAEGQILRALRAGALSYLPKEVRTGRDRNRDQKGRARRRGRRAINRRSSPNSNSTTEPKPRHSPGNKDSSTRPPDTKESTARQPGGLDKRNRAPRRWESSERAVKDA